MRRAQKYPNKRKDIKPIFTGPIDPTRVQLPTRKQRELTEEQIMRAKRIREQAEFHITYEDMSEEMWIRGFECDMFPERELRRWELAAQIYEQEMRFWSKEERKNVWWRVWKFINLNETHELEHVERLHQFYREYMPECLYGNFGHLEQELCKGHPWRFEVHPLLKQHLAKLWTEKISNERRAQIAAVTPDEIRFVLEDKSNGLFCSLGNDMIRHCVCHLLETPWIKDERKPKGEKYTITDTYNYMLLHPAEDQGLFGMVWMNFIEALLSEKNLWVYLDDLTCTPRSTETFSFVVDETIQKEACHHLLHHGDKLVMFAMLCVIEEKLVKESKTICSELSCKNVKNVVLQQCRGCRVAHYCSAMCQEKDWKIHKVFCKTVQQKFTVKGNTLRKKFITI